MELGRREVSPGGRCPGTRGALRWSRGELGLVLASGKTIGMQTNLFFFSFWPVLGRFDSGCDVTQQSWDWNPASVAGITRCSWAVPCALAPL